MGRHPTVLDATSTGFRQILARRSLGGSRPLNLNFYFTILEPKNVQIPIFGNFLKMDTPSQGGFGPQGPKGAQGAQAPLYLGPRGPKGAQAAPLYLK